MEGDYRLALDSPAGRRHAGGDGGALARLASALALAGLLAVPSPAFAPLVVMDGFAGDDTDGGDGVQGTEGIVPMVQSGSAEGHSGDAGTGAGGKAGAEGVERMKRLERQASAASRKLPLIVTLQIGEGTEAEPGDDPVTAVTARVMKRLETVMSAEDLAAVRTFSVLPIIALSADRDLIVRLLSMPEVASVERDREFRALDKAKSALELPTVEPQFRLESSGKSGQAPDPPLLESKLE